MSDMKFSEEHEWIRLDGEIATVGITDYAQAQLGDVVYVELPAIGKQVKQGDEMAVVESVKAASEVYAPVSGEVAAVNETLADAPETVIADALGAGWFVKLKVGDPSELDKLMDQAAYSAFTAGLG